MDTFIQTASSYAANRIFFPTIPSLAGATLTVISDVASQAFAWQKQKPTTFAERTIFSLIIGALFVPYMGTLFIKNIALSFVISTLTHTLFSQYTNPQKRATPQQPHDTKTPEKKSVPAPTPFNTPKPIYILTKKDDKLFRALADTNFHICWRGKELNNFLTTIANSANIDNLIRTINNALYLRLQLIKDDNTKLNDYLHFLSTIEPPSLPKTLITAILNFYRCNNNQEELKQEIANYTSLLLKGSLDALVPLLPSIKRLTAYEFTPKIPSPLRNSTSIPNNNLPPGRIPTSTTSSPLRTINSLFNNNLLARRISTPTKSSPLRNNNSPSNNESLDSLSSKLINPDDATLKDIFNNLVERKLFSDDLNNALTTFNPTDKSSCQKLIDTIKTYQNSKGSSLDQSTDLLLAQIKGIAMKKRASRR